MHPFIFSSRTAGAFTVTMVIIFASGTEARWRRVKRQGLGEFIPARTTDKPYLDNDIQGGLYLDVDSLNITSAPAVDSFANPVPSTTKAPSTPAVGAQKGLVTTKAPPTTAIVGYNANSPYPFLPDMPDIPYTGSKWNGPWGFPLGMSQGYRGSGQYVNHYNYYPISYFGSAMIPYAYGMGRR